jgi:hypothetical protein
MPRFSLFVVANLMLVPVMVAGQEPTMTEAQCRQMTDSMVLAMKSAIAPRGGVSDRDKQGAREMIERIEKLVFENRSRRIRECETWGRVARIIATE